jgi:hypothetical protein
VRSPLLSHIAPREGEAGKEFAVAIFVEPGALDVKEFEAEHEARAPTTNQILQVIHAWFYLTKLQLCRILNLKMQRYQRSGQRHVEGIHVDFFK